jgi:hypothetical protein
VIEPTEIALTTSRELTRPSTDQPKVALSWIDDDPTRPDITAATLHGFGGRENCLMVASLWLEALPAHRREEFAELGLRVADDVDDAALATAGVVLGMLLQEHLRSDEPKSPIARRLSRDLTALSDVKAEWMN